MRTLLIIMALFPSVLFAQQKVKVSGQVKGLPAGEKIYITDLNSTADTLFSGEIGQKGNFSLTNELAEPTIGVVHITNKKKLIVFLGDKKMHIETDTAVANEPKITHASYHNDFLAFKATFDPIFAGLRTVMNEIQQKGQSDSLITQYLSLREEIRDNIDPFVKQRPASPVSTFLLMVTMEFNEDVSVLNEQYEQLKPTAVNNSFGGYLKAFIDENLPTAIGAIAQDFTQNDPNGEPVSLSSFRGKYVLIDFWASWCRPCRVENPNIVAAYDRFSSKNFTVLGVSLDRPGQKEAWLRAIKDDKLVWTQVSDLQFWNNEVARLYKVGSIPQSFLINPEGKIVAKNLNGAALHEKLCELLGCD